MQLSISQTKTEMGRHAADAAAELIRGALAANGSANIIVATGASQFEMLGELVAAPDIAWSRVTIFHLDEYVGLGVEHPASFRRYLRERLIARLPAKPAAFHEIDGQADPVAECARLAKLIENVAIDVAMVGIGENAHLAFNDPPADFETTAPYLVVQLDEACRRQQLGEGWFATLDDVPKQAISMSIRQIMKSQAIVCTVPDRRKAVAVERSLQGPVSPQTPASILQEHPRVRLFLDEEAAAELEREGNA